MKVFQKLITIENKHIDMHNHVNNVVFLQFMQDIAFEHSKSLGHSLSMYKDLNTTWFAKKNTITYNRPALLNQEIFIKTWIENIKNTSATRHYEFILKSENILLCEAQTIWVYIDLKTKRPTKISQAIKKDFL